MNYILVVDDHVDIRRLLSITLGQHFEVLEAEDGASALQAIRRYHPRVVLLDVMMPGEFDGLQVLCAIKADPATRDTRVALLTGRGRESDREEAQQHGADAYFIKPFSPLQVIRWVRENAGGEVYNPATLDRVSDLQLEMGNA
jgi:CheY-like chemotaxis protein